MFLQYKLQIGVKEISVSQNTGRICLTILMCSHPYGPNRKTVEDFLPEYLDPLIG